MEDIKVWFDASVINVREDHLTKDIHIDRIIGKKYKELSKKEILNKSYSIFCGLVDHIVEKQINMEGIEVMLSIELVSESNKFIGKPNTVEEIEGLIETYSIPEIVIYKPINSHDVPFIEFYRIPILHDQLNDSYIKTFYKEFRSIQDVINDADYYRELNIVYIPCAK